MKVVLKCKLCGEILSISDTDIIGSCSCGETYIDFKEKEIIIGSKTGKSAFRFNLQIYTSV